MGQRVEHRGPGDQLSRPFSHRVIPHYDHRCVLFRSVRYYDPDLDHSGSLVMTLFPAFSALGMARKEDLQAVFVRSIKYLLLSTGPIIVVLMVFSSQLLDL